MQIFLPTMTASRTPSFFSRSHAGYFPRFTTIALIVFTCKRIYFGTQFVHQMCFGARITHRLHERRNTGPGSPLPVRLRSQCFAEWDDISDPALD